MEAKTISEVRNDGEFIELDDGSVWEIPPSDRARAKSWMPLQRVQVLSGEGDAYVIENLDTPDQASVAATI